jgi:hypothetical protein
MTRRTPRGWPRRWLWALCSSAVAALVAWMLISGKGGEPLASASVAKNASTLAASEGGSPAARSASAALASAVQAEPVNDASARSAIARRAAVYAEAAEADEARLQMLIEQARSIPDANERLAALEILLLKLAEHDATAAIRSALESERADAVSLIGALAASAPETVWRTLDQVGDPLVRMELQSAVIDAWTLRDPERAFNSVAAVRDDWVREQLLRQAAWGVARTDPEAAIELVNARPGSERDALLLAVADQWARQDPAGAAHWIETLSVRAQGQLAYRIAGPFVAQQPDEALAWALRISRTPGRNLWSHMIGLIAMRDPDEALRRAQAAENPAQRAQAMARAVAAIAVRDPALATTYARKLPPGRARSEAISQVAMQIARTRPDTAVDWLRELDEREMRTTAASAIAGQIANTDVEAAARLLDRVPKDARQYWIQEVARAYSESDPERGFEWVARQRDEAPQLTTIFLQQVAMRSPDEALALAERMAAGGERDQVLTQIVGMLAMQSPEAAARQMSRIHDEPSRTRAAGALAASWAQHDARGASKWARSLESGRVRDTALSNVAHHLEDLDDLFELVGDIQSPDQQMNAVFNAAAQRARSDPETARALMRRYPLDPQRQQQLEGFLQQRR